MRTIPIKLFYKPVFPIEIGLHLSCRTVGAFVWPLIPIDRRGSIAWHGVVSGSSLSCPRSSPAIQHVQGFRREYACVRPRESGGKAVG